jgi:hypothetical protein
MNGKQFVPGHFVKWRVVDMTTERELPSSDGTPPAAFLSHSGEDAELALRLATDLRRQGVNVWYADWEINPGDSLRMKIDGGLESASYFLALLTPASLNSMWVQTELDAAIVRRIEGVCKLIPVVSPDVPDSAIPATLRGIRYVRMSSYERGLSELVAACHQISSKPALGPSPVVRSPALPGLGLSPIAERLAFFLAERSEIGVPVASMQSEYEVQQSLNVSSEQLEMAVEELKDRHWLRVSMQRPVGPAGFSSIGPNPELFFAMDPSVKGWSPESDAMEVAAALVNTGAPQPSLREVAQVLGWPPRRLNPAVYFLERQGAILTAPTMGSAPYAYPRVGVTAKTKQAATL